MPAQSKAQQRFMGAVLNAKRTGEASTPEVADAAANMKTKDVKDFASTKHKGLPEKKDVKEESSYRDFVKNAQSASDRVKKAKQAQRDSNAKSAYKDKVTKGVKFYDKKGKGHIRDGKKVYS